MIRALRFWHRRWFVLLAITLPILLFFALSERPVAPTIDGPAGALASSAKLPAEGELP